jgi:DNA gyrase subunit A
LYDKTKTNIVPVDIDKEMRKSFLEYSMSVIVSRALPDVRDGLKPVHRRILYTLHENGLTPEKPYRKCADTVGSVLGRYHPHGDSSVYDALVRLAQKFSLRYPLIDGHGNFGSVDGDPPAAYRYTESKMSKMAVEMLTDINKDTVDFIPNYDDRLKEPSVLPSRFPNLLVNGSVGIAVGMATNIPPHNLGEVIDGINLLIENPDCTLDELMEVIKAPDFPTGGVIMGKAGIRSAYGTGRGKITLRAKTENQEVKGRNCIIITEIPYMVNKAKLVEHIADLSKDKKIDGIQFIRDESDRNGMRIVIGIKKDASPTIVLNKLFTYTQLQDTVGVIMLALVNGEPKVLTLKEMLEYYLEFQREVIRRRTIFDLKKAEERSHILQGFVLATDYIDEVIAILRKSSSIAEGKANLIERFKDIDMATLINRAEITCEHTIGLSDAQAEAIVQMKLGQLTGLERNKIIDELLQLYVKIADFKDILANDDRVYKIISDELAQIRKKFADARLTSLEDVEGEVDIEDLIPVEDCVITYTNKGYIKRVPTDMYKTQKRGGRGVSGMKQRDEDFVNEMFVASTHDNVLFISNKGIMYKLKGYEIPSGSKNARGVNYINLFSLSENERISAMLKTSEFTKDKYIVMVTKQGKIKRSNLYEYRNAKKHGLKALLLDDGDELAGVRLTDGTNELLIATKLGKIIRIKEDSIRCSSRNAHGIKAMTLQSGDEIVSMARVREGATVLTISDKGLGRRTTLDAYALQGRGGLGRINYKVSESRGYVCGIKVVDDTDDIIMISTDGVIIRIKASDINIMSRTAGGVKVMRLSNDDRVVTFTRTEHEDDVETDSIDVDVNVEDSSETETEIQNENE